MVSVRAEQETVDRILTSLQERIGTTKFNAWFKHGTQLAVEDGKVKLAVPNPFVANWIESHYLTELGQAAGDEVGNAVEVLVTVDPGLSDQCGKRTLDTQARIVQQSTAGAVRPRKVPAPVPCRYRLQDFVIGASNRLAYSAARALAEGEARFNPLFVHGPCGVGKTHLLQGVCNRGRHAGDGRAMRWRYVTAETFTNEFVTALRKKQVDGFRARYRNLDLLAIDDVHFLAAKKATQDEFLHTFNAIQSAGKQIVLASDTHPRLVGELNEQLTSRFQAGMVVKIEPPDKPTRLAILQRLADRPGMRIEPDVLEYVALHVRGSVRELEGALVKLTALAALEDGEVTLDVAAAALTDHLARADSAVTLSDIEAVVAPYFGVTPADLHSSRRTRTVSAARMTAMYLARRHTSMSYPEIGRMMGKNHSSVVLAVQRMEKVLHNGDTITWTTPAGPRKCRASELLSLLNDQLS
jgi:chromosomal replication initiator protein